MFTNTTSISNYFNYVLFMVHSTIKYGCYHGSRTVLGPRSYLPHNQTTSCQYKLSKKSATHQRGTIGLAVLESK